MTHIQNSTSQELNKDNDNRLQFFNLRNNYKFVIPMKLVIENCKIKHFFLPGNLNADIIIGEAENLAKIEMKENVIMKKMISWYMNMEEGDIELPVSPVLCPLDV